LTASVQQTNDGGYILAGSTTFSSEGFPDFWLIKTDTLGNEEWSRTFGGSSYDYAHSVQQTDDGGYIITGGTQSYGAGNWDIWLIKTDSYGNEEWHHTFGESTYDYAWSVQQISDGGYIIAGSTDSYGIGIWDDYLLIKTNFLGDEEWHHTFGGSSYEIAQSVQQTADNGYILAGYTGSYGSGCEDAWLIRTNSSGNELWNRTLGGEGCDRSYSVQQTTDGGFILAGSTESYGAETTDAWLIKVCGDE